MFVWRKTYLKILDEYNIKLFQNNLLKTQIRRLEKELHRAEQAVFSLENRLEQAEKNDQRDPKTGKFRKKTK